jgi:hypothetical protein
MDPYKEAQTIKPAMIPKAFLRKDKKVRKIRFLSIKIDLLFNYL